MGWGELNDKPPRGASHGQELDFATEAWLCAQPVPWDTLPFPWKSWGRADGASRPRRLAALCMASLLQPGLAVAPPRHAAPPGL